MYTAVSADDAVKIVKSGDRVFIHTAAAAPQELINALTNRGDELKAVELIHMHIDGKAPYADPKYKESFYINNLFIGANVRYAVEEGQASYMPIFLRIIQM